MKMNEAVKLQPDFSDLKKPETILKHIEELQKPQHASHDEILKQLLEAIEPVDYLKEAFPQADELSRKLEEATKLSMSYANGEERNSPEAQQANEEMKRLNKELERLKITVKHFEIITIEQLLKLAEKNKWGICKNQDFIYLYNGAYWKEIDKEAFQKFLGEAAEKMSVSKFTARHFQFRERLFKQFISTAYLPTPHENNDKVLINLRNGTFEIDKNGKTKLRPANQKDFLTYQLGFDYQPEATAPMFETYLNRVLPDKDIQNILAEYLGFVFIKQSSKTLKLEKMLVLYGTGANGKSVFFEIVNALLGSENVCSYSLQELTDHSGYYRAMIANKLVNYASEINGKMETDIFKKMVSGEPLPARLPYGKPMSLEQYARLIFNCNELPKDVEHTNAYFRRFLIIPFDVTIPENEQDKSLSYRISEEELSGVFNWALKGLMRLLDQKNFTKSDAVTKALEDYKTESNSVQMFLNEFDYRKSANNWKTIKELFIEYRTFCIEDGMSSFKKSNFIKQLKNLGFEVKRVTGNQVAVYLEN